MRFFPTIYLASGAVAAVVAPQNDQPNCILYHRAEMAEEAECGNRDIIKTCFEKLETQAVPQLEECYKSAGCTDDKASVLALGAEERCLTKIAGGELRKRSRGVLEARAPEPTYMARADDLLENAPGLLGRATTSSANTETMSGSSCVTASLTKVESCEPRSSGGGSTCSNVEQTSWVCTPGWTCSFNVEGTHICMILHNSLDIAGIIVAIVMAVGAIAGIVTITYLCIQNKKEQKRLFAKAEATALARAATKKKRAAERAPLNQGVLGKEARTWEVYKRRARVVGGDSPKRGVHLAVSRLTL
ncbi:unnamed protein product [Clonostachys byssicola]|uniref:Extracellular membrane protein CFEM domain-containing protein n=1 Tax=Clonostachys byssicola TaxID=160290 RepID=A0A9N9U053_9HYPO|nr:unnamed protein product [Clonostachys byssicola]